MGYKLKRILIYPDGVTEKQVYPAGWTPGDNTVAYYPLTAESTVNDKSGNGNNFSTTGTVTFGDNAGLSCGSFSNGYLYLNKSLITGNNNFTGSVWVYCISGNGGYIYAMGTTSAQNGFVIGTDPRVWYGWRGTNVTTNTNMTTGQWHLLTVTYDKTTIKVYRDGTMISSTNQTLNLSNTKTILGMSLNTSVTSRFNGYFSNLIVENTVRDATKVSHYFDITKSNYGL